MMGVRGAEGTATARTAWERLISAHDKNRWVRDMNVHERTTTTEVQLNVTVTGLVLLDGSGTEP